jgi:hypothetical protein
MARWQYQIVNLGTFGVADRMANAFGVLGSQGWELVALHDKASNWLGGMEKGFAVFKREVVDGEEPDWWGRWQYADAVSGAHHHVLGQGPSSECGSQRHDECPGKRCTCSCHGAWA